MTLDNNTRAQEFFQAAPALYVPQPVPAANSAIQAIKGIPVGTSPWWINRLISAMAGREARLKRLRSYYRGEQDTWRLSSEAFKTTFGRALFGMKANLAQLIVDAPVQRMQVTGFRIPLKDVAPTPAPPILLPGQPAPLPDLAAIDETDPEAWRIWQSNNLDSWSIVAMAEAVTMGECPILIDRDPDAPRTPRITVEDPLQVFVERDPANPQRRRAALKRFVDDDGTIVHILYLPDRVEWWRATSTTKPGTDNWGWVVGQTASNLAFQLRGVHFELDGAKSGRPPVPGEIPIVLLLNKPRIDGTGEGDFESVLPLLDLYNKTLMDIAVTAEFHAAPQRYATGISLDEEAEAVDAQGNTTQTATSPLKAAPDRVWTTENPDAQFGQFPESKLEGYATIFDELTSKIGTITFTPYHYLLNMPSSVPPTGESLKSAETPLVSKVQRKEIDFGEAWEEVMRIAFLTIGDVRRATAEGSEVDWVNPESRIMSVLADALTKLATIGVPERALWRLWGFSPPEIARFDAMRAASPVPQAPLRVTVPGATPAEVTALGASTEGGSATVPAQPAARVLPASPPAPGA